MCLAFDEAKHQKIILDLNGYTSLPLKGQIGSVEDREKLIGRLRWVDPIKLPVSVGDSIQLASNVIISRRTYIARRRLAIRRRSPWSRARTGRCATVRGRRRSGRIGDDVNKDQRPYPHPDSFSHVVIAMRDRNRVASCRYGSVFIGLCGLDGSPTGSRFAV